MNPPRQRIAVLGIALAATAILAGCGGSSSTSRAATATSSQAQSSAASSGGVAGAASGSETKGPAARKRAAGRRRAQSLTATASNSRGATKRRSKVGRYSNRQPNEASRGTIDSVVEADPCKYVTAAEAASILHAPSVTETEAPLGPTCIFSARRTKVSTTLAVQVIEVTKEVHEMKHLSQMSIAGRTAYCGTIGGSVLLVPLADGAVLEVSSAPCSQARAFAAIALSRIKT